MARCDELATFTEEPGRITRPYGTPALTAARELVAQWMRDAGLDVRIDAVGNVRGRVEGSEPTAPALLLGSHLDSVRDAGRYDGPLGILVAIEAVDRLRERRQPAPFPVEVIAFADEEGLRFQTTYLGSCALAGSFDPAFLDLADDERGDPAPGDGGVRRRSRMRWPQPRCTPAKHSRISKSTSSRGRIWSPLPRPLGW